MKFKIAIFIGLIVMGSACTAGQYTGQFMPMWDEDTFMLVPVRGQSSRTNEPSCARAEYLVLQEEDTSSDIFKHKYSLLLASWLAKKSITLRDTGECRNSLPVIEAINWID